MNRINPKRVLFFERRVSFIFNRRFETADAAILSVSFTDWLMEHLSRFCRVFLILFICSFAYCVVLGQVTVEVSPNFSAISYSNTADVTVDDYEAFELFSPEPKDDQTLFFTMSTGNLNLKVIDKIEQLRNNLRPKFLLERTLRSSGRLLLPKSPSGEGLIVLILSDSNRPIQITTLVYRTGIRNLEIRNMVKEMLEIPILALSSVFKLPRFKIRVTPCGTKNAYSSPDITICSELLSDLVENELVGALYPVLYHELAHSLLRMWNLPGYDNEDIADEFAATMLARFFPKFIDAFITYLNRNDSTLEAIRQLELGSRHTISVQRGRNIANAMTRIDELESRWETLLKPYQLKSAIH